MKPILRVVINDKSERLAFKKNLIKAGFELDEDLNTPHVDIWLVVGGFTLNNESAKRLRFLLSYTPGWHGVGPICKGPHDTTSYMVWTGIMRGAGWVCHVRGCGKHLCLEDTMFEPMDHFLFSTSPKGEVRQEAKTIGALSTNSATRHLRPFLRVLVESDANREFFCSALKEKGFDIISPFVTIPRQHIDIRIVDTRVKPRKVCDLVLLRDVLSSRAISAVIGPGCGGHHDELVYTRWIDGQWACRHPQCGYRISKASSSFEPWHSFVDAVIESKSRGSTVLQSTVLERADYASLERATLLSRLPKGSTITELHDEWLIEVPHQDGSLAKMEIEKSLRDLVGAYFRMHQIQGVVPGNVPSQIDNPTEGVSEQSELEQKETTLLRVAVDRADELFRFMVGISLQDQPLPIQREAEQILRAMKRALMDVKELTKKTPPGV